MFFKKDYVCALQDVTQSYGSRMQMCKLFLCSVQSLYEFIMNVDKIVRHGMAYAGPSLSSHADTPPILSIHGQGPARDHLNPNTNPQPQGDVGEQLALLLVQRPRHCAEIDLLNLF